MQSHSDNVFVFDFFMGVKPDRLLEIDTYFK